VITKQYIMEAVSRGWCSDKNKKKVFDVDLAKEIVSEVMKVLDDRKKGTVTAKARVKTLEDIKDELLEKAKAKDVKAFMQYDIHLNYQSDDLIQADKDGDAITWRHTMELRNTDCLRFQFPPDTSPFDVIRALDKIKDCIKDSMKRGFRKEEIVRHTKPKSKPEGISPDIPF